MKRREVLKSLVAAAASGCVLRCAGEDGPGGARPARPNILFVFADQLRPDFLGPYGGDQIETPHLDALAREGMTFLNGLSTCPLCAPYRGMLMTGRYPTHSGILLNRINVSPRQNPHCLAQLFDETGYRTGYLGKWHLSAGIKGVTEKLDADDSDAALESYIREHPEVEFTPPGPDRLGYEHWEAYNYHTDFRDYWFYRDTPERIFGGGYETDVLVDQAKTFMDGRRRDGKPFLLMVAPHPPHPPFTPDHCPPGYLEKIPASLARRANVPPDKARELEPQVRCYLAMVRHFDDCVGRLVSYLDESGLSANTLLVVTSDHGEMHGSHGLVGKLYPYAESVNIPLLMRRPGFVPAGVRVTVPYTPMDHMPTLCAMAGVPVSPQADGVDLSAVLSGGAAPQRDGVLMMSYVAGYANFRSGGVRPEWRGVRTEEYTYVRWLEGREALFDNVDDPLQMHDLVEAGGEPAVLDKLRARLDELLAQAHDEFLPGTAYADWYAPGRKLVRTALGPVA